MSKKRSYNEYSTSSRGQSNDSVNSDRKRYHAKKNDKIEKKSVSTREEIRELTKIVKEFNSKSLEGVKKTNFHQDKLTALGALPRKQQKVPYPMKLGLMKAKKKREQKALLEQKDSQVVLVAAGTNVTKSNKNNVTNYRRNSRR